MKAQNMLLFIHRMTSQAGVSRLQAVDTWHKLKSHSRQYPIAAANSLIKKYGLQPPHITKLPEVER